jgi:hypothetical protein
MKSYARLSLRRPGLLLLSNDEAVIAATNRVLSLRRVLLFRRYLELMTVLQEQHSELKELHAHKLFYRSPRSRFHPSTCQLFFLFVSFFVR